MIKTEKTEMGIKGKSVVESMGIYKSEAGAVSIAESRDVMLAKYHGSIIFNSISNLQQRYSGFGKSVHKQKSTNIFITVYHRIDIHHA